MASCGMDPPNPGVPVNDDELEEKEEAEKEGDADDDGDVAKIDPVRPCGLPVPAPFDNTLAPP